MEMGRDDARFRAWLGTVIRNAVYNHCSQATTRKRRETNAAASNPASENQPSFQPHSSITGAWFFFVAGASSPVA
ncbi:hypothetical protein BSZ32_09745 [Rubritalea profundi]|uniref:RNA polymerase sigma-70 region 2 domain-containing protein n=1 Tax=Rubritalea profundi TaxID=1658618 RepID=A0A2S7U3M5_9BACT|nr:hypothetical protein BSZ32_09745 [Rubritalea profundi]